MKDETPSMLTMFLAGEPSGGVSRSRSGLEVGHGFEPPVTVYGLEGASSSWECYDKNFPILGFLLKTSKKTASPMGIPAQPQNFLSSKIFPKFLPLCMESLLAFPPAVVGLRRPASRLDYRRSGALVSLGGVTQLLCSSGA